MKAYKRFLGWCLLVPVLLSAGCNDFEYTTIEMTMVNETSWTVYMWVESLEEVSTATKLLPNQTRTFKKVYTFTDEHPKTHLWVVGTKDGVNTSTIFTCSKDSANYTAVYNSEARVAVTLNNE